MGDPSVKKVRFPSIGGEDRQAIDVGAAVRKTFDEPVRNSRFEYEATFKKGEMLFQHGDPGGDLFFIRSGSVSIFRTREGTEVPFCTMGRGEIIGVMTLLDCGKRTASARALTDVTVFVVRNRKFRKLIEKAPQWLITLVKDLSSRLDNTSHRFVDSFFEAERLQETRGDTSLVRLARVVKGMLHLGEHLSNETHAGQEVDAQYLLNELSLICGYSRLFLDEVLGLLYRQGILTKMKEGAGIPAAQMLHLKTLVEMIYTQEKCRTSPKGDQAFVSGDVAPLEALHHNVCERCGGDMTITIPVGYLLNEKEQIYPALIEKALHFGIVQREDDTRIRISQPAFTVKVRCIMAMFEGLHTLRSQKFY